MRVAVKAGIVTALWLPDKPHKHSFESQRTVNALLCTHDRAAHCDQWVTHTGWGGPTRCAESEPEPPSRGLFLILQAGLLRKQREKKHVGMELG